MPRPARWELPLSALCAVLTFVPLLRLPAAFALLCLLPGIAVCRHRLGETSTLRILILGSLLSLCIVPAVTIPVALLAGRPVPILTVAVLCAVIGIVSLRPVASRPPAPLPGLSRIHLTVIAVCAVLMQSALTARTYPSPDTIRWQGLPDLVFFNGIYTQLSLHVPPFDPENGSALLVHNWVYHFHFALLHLLSGLSIPSMMRVVSLWMALTLLGLVYLICCDLLRSAAAGLGACLLLMTSGEIAWLVRSAAHLSLDLRPLPWQISPFGITLLFGWYNLPPLSVALGVWYWLERNRESGRTIDLVVSIVLCAALAFFHPIFYGVFMIGFCLWLVRLWLREGPRPARLAFLLTALPFLLFYKIPYYGMSMPPRVVSLELSPAPIAGHLQDLLLSCGIYLALGAIGLLVTRGATGPLAWIALSSIACVVFLDAPNPHWFNDLLYIVLAIASGIGLAWMASRWQRTAAAIVMACILIASVSFYLHQQVVLSNEYRFTHGEIAAADWLRQNTGVDDLIAILPNSKSSYAVLALGQRRLVHGWTGHLLDFHRDALRQEGEVREIFTTREPDRAATLARRYHLSYVYLGREETSSVDPAGLTAPCFPVVFSADGVEIRAFTCRSAPL